MARTTAKTVSAPATIAWAAYVSVTAIRAGPAAPGARREADGRAAGAPGGGEQDPADPGPEEDARALDRARDRVRGGELLGSRGEGGRERRLRRPKRRCDDRDRDGQPVDGDGRGAGRREEGDRGEQRGPYQVARRHHHP